MSPYIPARGEPGIKHAFNETRIADHPASYHQHHRFTCITELWSVVTPRPGQCRLYVTDVLYIEHLHRHVSRLASHVRVTRSSAFYDFHRFRGKLSVSWPENLSGIRVNSASDKPFSSARVILGEQTALGDVRCRPTVVRTRQTYVWNAAEKTACPTGEDTQAAMTVGVANVLCDDRPAPMAWPTPAPAAPPLWQYPGERPPPCSCSPGIYAPSSPLAVPLCWLPPAAPLPPAASVGGRSPRLSSSAFGSHRPMTGRYRLWVGSG
ncbi:hypothetical protein KGM_201151 [Danaus plexippus plexippus]|uniref:Uncharacterized protein n=1 Tax=Danaus plexippus plexippus TaxID=278856 RepID=A0A212ERA9_DANPL|nr:hypothetical protein KGM_201151 [Danaus plexippus plexippus]